MEIIEPQGLEPVESLDSIEMKEATIKCLQADGISEAGYIEKHVLSKLIAGDDALLQLRGNMLPLYVIYPIIDLLANAIPEIYVLIVMNRLDAQSSKSFISSFNKHLEHSGLNVAVHLVSHEKDFGPGSLIAVNPTTPTVFFTTVDMMVRLKAENVFQSKSVFAMIVYEAEYVLRRHINVKTISPILDDFESCQLILACHDGTEDVFNGAEALSLAEDSIMISQDYINLHAAEHYYLMNSALTDKLVDRVVELSKENVAVLICHDATETNRLKIKLAERTQVYTLTKVAELNLITNGLLITPQVISTILDSKPHGKVCMIVNLSGVVTPPDRYLEMLASYMDIGEKCTVVSKVGTRDALKSIEELGVTFQEFTASTEL
ncbi:hypothetical protein BGZ99_006696 [Dissophora globulifera]|uniref:Uncharacterized protein n=1 Tax=Dissophora globulifera TaxID=979702 RepID=A0A9P6RDQ8_9FUNG|nr:hypothetical protein BGZ99_006696 [Dissophora globulifera]